jgi:hypothetical protein
MSVMAERTVTGVAHACGPVVAEALLTVEQLGDRDLQVREHALGGAGVEFRANRKVGGAGRSG